MSSKREDGSGTPPRWAGALAGLAAAAAALGAGELVVGIVGDDDPSLVAAVGAEFIDRFAASLKDIAVELFGTNDKVALVVGIVIMSMLFGALLGVVAVKRFLVAALGFVAFGLVGFAAYRADELGRPATGLVASVVAAGVGVATLRWLFWIWAHPPSTVAAMSMGRGAGDAERVTSSDAATVDDGVLSGGRLIGAPRSSMDPREVARRTFLAAVAAAGVAAGAVALLGRRMAGRGASEAARLEVVLPASGDPAPTVSQPFTVEEVSTYITPNEDFYRIDTALTIPQVSLDDWKLDFTGSIDNPFSISYQELLDMDPVEHAVTIACVSNEVGGNLVGNAVWRGVPLAALLERAGVPEGLQGPEGQLVGRSLDGWAAGFPMDVALDGRTALVAYAMNGEPLPVRHGFPARLIVAGLYGYVSATKWLAAVEVTRWDDFDGYWIPRGWAKEGPIKTMSRIDVPRPGADLAEGPVTVGGVAWAPTRGIARVEVQVDEGDWQECELGRVQSNDTWVQWRYRWQAEPGEHRIAVRATDGTGEVQTSEVASPAPDGASGWHGRRVRVG